MEGSGQLHAPAALPPRKEPQYPLDRRLGGRQSQSGRGGEEKNSQPLPGFFFFFLQNGQAPGHSTHVTAGVRSVQKTMRLKWPFSLSCSIVFWRLLGRTSSEAMLQHSLPYSPTTMQLKLLLVRVVDGVSAFVSIFGFFLDVCRSEPPDRESSA